MVHGAGNSSVDGARGDGAGQVRAAADVCPAAGDIHDGGAAGDAAAAAAAAGRQVAGGDGGDIAGELRAVPEHGVREPGVHQVLPGGDAAGGAGLPQHRQPPREAQDHAGDLQPSRHPLGVRVDADAAGAPGVARRGARPAGRLRQGPHPRAPRHVRGVALLPVHGGPHRDGGGQGGRAHGQALRRRAGARRGAAGARGGAPAGAGADGELRAGGERSQEAVRQQPQPAEADRQQAHVPQPHEHAAGRGPPPPPPGRRQPQAPRRAAHHHQRHCRRHAQHRLTPLPSSPLQINLYFLQLYFRLN